jgi:hypothetical protein
VGGSRRECAGVWKGGMCGETIHICELNQITIKVSILDILSKLTLDSRNYYYDEKLKNYEVAVDETKFEKRTKQEAHHIDTLTQIIE